MLRMPIQILALTLVAIFSITSGLNHGPPGGRTRPPVGDGPPGPGEDGPPGPGEDGPPGPGEDGPPWNNGPREPCCRKKEVDGQVYLFKGRVKDEELSEYQCKNGCIYWKWKDEDKDAKYCFKSGGFSSICLEEKEPNYTKDPSYTKDPKYTKKPNFSKDPKPNYTKEPNFSKDPTDGGNEGATDAVAATTVAAVTGAAVDTTAAVADDAIMTRVKGYIDAGTCGRISSTSNCGSSATSYFKSFTYKGKNVVISSQVPDHPAEHDMLQKNPNTRCERWQYIQLPLEPTKGSSSSATSLGTVGLAVTGGAFFNDLANPQGGIAFANEVISLDSCFGHSAPGGSYHYHANINCTDAGAAKGANDPSKCVLIGYYNDGVPVYGFCKDSKEKQMTSCFKIKDGVTTSTVQHVSGSYSGIGATESDYTYDTAAFTAGTCNLDIANGAVHPTTGKYSYFVTTGFPWVPKNYFGKEGTSSLCSAA